MLVGVMEWLLVEKMVVVKDLLLESKLDLLKD